MNLDVAFANRHLVVTLAVLAAVLVLLAWELLSAEIIMLAALVILVLAGVLKPDEATAGFANSSVIAIGALFVIGAGLRSTGAIEHLGVLMLGRPNAKTSTLRLFAPIAALSAFMNNTTLVAAFLPLFVQVAKRTRISPSKLLIPLSYASVLGGTCTVIGTSTNLVVDGMMRKESMGSISMFELAWVGVPVTIVGLIYLSTIGQKLLPDRVDLLEHVGTHRREYTVEMFVRPDCPLVGQSVRKAGLRDLPGLYLFQIERGSETIVPVAPEEEIAAGDLLGFSGIVSTVVDLQKIRGLEPVDHRDDAPKSANGGNGGPAAFSSLDSLEGLPPGESAKGAKRTGHQLSEVVISPFSPLVGKSIKEVSFRSRYQASVIAVHRSGEQLQQKIGQVVLQPGDTLMVDAPEDFVHQWRNSSDFILVSSVEDSAPLKFERVWLALAIFVSVIIGMSLFNSTVAIVAMLGALAMTITGCVPKGEVYRSIELPVLLLVGASLGVGRAMETSGAAQWLASGLMSMCSGFGPVGLLVAIVLLTGLLTELLSNNAAAALMASLAIAAAQASNIDPRPLLIGVTVAASYGFATPIGYQTNLMVLNPGGYRFMDYVRIGVPLDLICWLMTALIIPFVWPIRPL